MFWYKKGVEDVAFEVIAVVSAVLYTTVVVVALDYVVGEWKEMRKRRAG